jgi:hypothetical protein
MGRKRRSFSKEFKAATVALIGASEKTVGQIEADLGISESLSSPLSPDNSIWLCGNNHVPAAVTSTAQ